MKDKTTETEDTRFINCDPRGVFFDLFDPDEAAELTMRAELLRGLQARLARAGTRAAAAQVLGETQSRVSDIKCGKLVSFKIDLLLRLAVQAGLHPQPHLAT